MKLPAAIAENLVVQELGDETLIYNLTNHKAYVLNETSSVVFNACGNNQTFEHLGTKYKYTADLIYLALDELRRENLLVGYESNHFGELSRRAVIKKVGLATMISLPLITGIIAPSAVNAASGGSSLYRACQTSGDCGSDAPNCADVFFPTSQSRRCCITNRAQPNGTGNSRNDVIIGNCAACRTRLEQGCCSTMLSEFSCRESNGTANCIGTCT